MLIRDNKPPTDYHHYQTIYELHMEVAASICIQAPRLVGIQNVDLAPKACHCRLAIQILLGAEKEGKRDRHTVVRFNLATISIWEFVAG